MSDLLHEIDSLGLQDIRGKALEEIQLHHRQGTPILLFGGRSYANMVRRLLATHGVPVAEMFADNDPDLKNFDAIKATYDSFVIIFGCVLPPAVLAQRQRAFECPQLRASYFLELPFPIDEVWLTRDLLKVRLPDYAAIAAVLADELSVRTLVHFLAAKLSGDTRQLPHVFESKAYFLNDVVSVTDQSVLLDCGAFTGDTLQQAIQHAVPFKEYHAFEPDPSNYRALYTFASTCNDQRIVTHQLGVFDRSAMLRFADGFDTSSLICEDGTTTVQVDRIDRLVPNATFIKMDIEGAEYEALLGASATITSNKPTLAICVYHKIDDLIRVVALLKQLRTDYRFYLRLHSPWSSRELVLYAV